jgi:hypothetical protein
MGVRINWEVPPSRRIAFVIVLVAAAVSILASVVVGFRASGYLLAMTMALAAALRALLPAKYCLGLLVRSRQFDVAIAVLLAVALASITGVVPAG